VAPGQKKEKPKREVGKGYEDKLNPTKEKEGGRGLEKKVVKAVPVEGGRS